MEKITDYSANYFLAFIRKVDFDGLSEMIYKALLIALAVFTLLDAANTAMGVSIGLIELDPIVKELGLDLWIILRILLLGGVMATFFEGYIYCLRHFKKGILPLEAALFVLDAFLGAVVFSGFLAITLELF